MGKFRKIFVSLSVAAMIAACGMSACADETEVSETTAAEEVTESTELVLGDAAPASGAVINVVGEELSASDSQTLASYATESISLVTGMTEEQMNDILKPSSVLSVPQKSAVSSVESWKNAMETLGAYKAPKEHTITVSDDTITIESVCDFANCEGVVTTVLDRATLTMDSMTFSENDDSFAKVMEEAAMNTVMGLGIVFLTLLFLSFLISQFKHVSKLENALSGRKKAAPAVPAAKKAAPAASAPHPASKPAAHAPVVEDVDDSELIAVIAAAIAAYEGTTSTDGFVVRSIKKRNRNKWQRA